MSGQKHGYYHETKPDNDMDIDRKWHIVFSVLMVRGRKSNRKTKGGME